MMAWSSRPGEEKALLSPSFCSMLLWSAAGGYSSGAGGPLPLDVTFLVLPIVLHCETRELLPKAVTTSLAVWLAEHPLARSRIAERAARLVAFTKEALMFGGLHGLLDLAGGSVTANADWKSKVAGALRSPSDEVRACAKRADFVGKWFAKAGSPATVMALVGVKP
jgi:hypothetical protein